MSQGTAMNRMGLYEHWAREFHDTYERLAPEFGYKTREASAVPWEDVPEQNKALMVATVSHVMRGAVRAERERIITRLVEMADALDPDAVARTAETLRRAAAVLDVEGGQYSQEQPR